MRPNDERYAVVVVTRSQRLLVSSQNARSDDITKAEGMEVVLHGLQRQRAERIAARKNRNCDAMTNVQPVREDELDERSVQLKHPDD